MSEVLAWAAGFFDGEGTAGCWKNNNGTGNPNYRRLTASIAQNDKHTLEVFQQALGGHLAGPFRAIGSTGGHWRLTFSGASVVALYKALKPFLIFKGPQFEKAIGEYDAYQSSRVHNKPGPKGIPK